jgi:hypothetical protein
MYIKSLFSYIWISKQNLTKELNNLYASKRLNIQIDVWWIQIFLGGSKTIHSTELYTHKSKSIAQFHILNNS